MPPPGGRGFFTHQQSILCLNDGLACQMQVSLFLMRGLQVFPAGLKPIAWVGLLISLFPIFVAPLRVAIRRWLFRRCLSRTASCGLCRAPWGRADYSCTFPLAAGIKKADMIFHLGFFILLR